MQPQAIKVGYGVFSLSTAMATNTLCPCRLLRFPRHGSKSLRRPHTFEKHNRVSAPDGQWFHANVSIISKEHFAFGADGFETLPEIS
jgi:hypothetical protein